MTHSHDHTHASDCGHRTVTHGDHSDYLHDGHLHHVAGDTIAEHVIKVDDDHPSVCTPDHSCEAHDASHTHSDTCGHDRVPHGDHTGYLVDGHLHFPHGTHCDDHGALVG